jgi:hypothetical protein
LWSDISLTFRGGHFITNAPTLRIPILYHGYIRIQMSSRFRRSLALSTQLLWDQFIDWVKSTYGTIGEVKVKRGKFHTYLGMILDYSAPGQVIIDMTRYVEEMIKGFPSESFNGKKVASPWNENLFRFKTTALDYRLTGVSCSIP